MTVGTKVNIDGVRDYGAFESNFPLAQVTRAVKGAIRYNPLYDLIFDEQWLAMDDTHRALEYDISTYTDAGSSADVSSNLGYLTLTTDGTGTDKAGLATMAAIIDPANLPDLQCEVTLPSVAGVDHKFGFFKDANEYAYFHFDASAATTWYYKAHDGTTASSVNTGVTADTSATTLRIAIDENGYVHAWIDGVDVTGPALKATTTDPMKLYIVTQEEAAAAKTSLTRYFSLVQSR